MRRKIGRVSGSSNLRAAVGAIAAPFGGAYYVEHARARHAGHYGGAG
jgi:hypothetical protein